MTEPDECVATSAAPRTTCLCPYCTLHDSPSLTDPLKTNFINWLTKKKIEIEPFFRFEYSVAGPPHCILHTAMYAHHPELVSEAHTKAAAELNLLRRLLTLSQPGYLPEVSPAWAWFMARAGVNAVVDPPFVTNLIAEGRRPRDANAEFGALRGIYCGPLAILRAIALAPRAGSVLSTFSAAFATYNQIEPENFFGTLTYQSPMTVHQMMAMSDLLADAAPFNVAMLGIDVDQGVHTPWITPLRFTPSCHLWIVYMPGVDGDVAHWEAVHLEQPDAYNLGQYAVGAAWRGAPPMATPEELPALLRAQYGVVSISLTPMTVEELQAFNAQGQHGAWSQEHIAAVAVTMRPAPTRALVAGQHALAQNVVWDRAADRCEQLVAEEEESWEALLEAFEEGIDKIEVDRPARLAALLQRCGINIPLLPGDDDTVLADSMLAAFEDQTYTMEVDCTTALEEMRKNFIAGVIALAKRSCGPRTPSWGRVLEDLEFFAVPTSGGLDHGIRIMYGGRWWNHRLCTFPTDGDVEEAATSLECEFAVHLPPPQVEVDSHYANAHFVGCNPPTVLCSHWCGAGSTAAQDLVIVGALRAHGITTCNCRWLLWGRCWHYWVRALRQCAAPQLVATSFGETAVCADYLVPIKRPGWVPFAVPEGEKGVIFGLQSGNTLRPEETVPSHRLVSSVGPFPALSAAHRCETARHRSIDPLHLSPYQDKPQKVGDLEAVESIHLRYEPSVDNRARLLRAAGAVTVAGIVALLLWFIAALVRQASLPPLACGEHGEWSSHWPPLPEVRAGVVHEFDYVFSRWLQVLLTAVGGALRGAWLYCKCIVAYLLSDGVRAAAISWILSNLTYLLASASSCVLILVCLFMVWELIHWVVPRRRYEWTRHQPRWMVPLVRRCMLTPDLDKIVPSVLAMWDGVNPIRPILQSKIVRELFQAGWGSLHVAGEHTGYADAVAVECLSRLIVDCGTHCSSAFRGSMPHKAGAKWEVPGARRIRIMMDRMAEPTGPRERLRCHRPGCTRSLGPGKNPHHLCRPCRDSLRDGGDLSRLWQNGECGMVYPDAYVAIHEREFPLPTTKIDLGGGSLSPGHDEEANVYRHDEPSAVRPNLAGFLAGFGLALAQPFATLKSYVAVYRAIMARLFKANPCRPDAEAWHHIEALAYAPGGLLGPLDHVVVQPLSLEQWLDGFMAPRRMVLRTTETVWAAMSHSWEAISWRSHRAFAVFTKREWLSPIEVIEDEMVFQRPDHKPRLIQPPEDICHLATGPAMRAVTGWLKHHWNWQRHVFYASVTPELLDKWLQSIADEEMFLACDYSMFDCTHSRVTWGMMERLYRKLLPPDWEHYELFFKVLKHWEAPWGTARGKRSERHYTRARYKGRVMNASGRDDTALANALLNAIAMSSSIAAAWWGVELKALTATQWQELQGRCRLAVVGDDSIAAIPSRMANGERVDVLAFQEAVDRNIRSLGFVPKSTITDRWQDIVFLGCRPYRVRGKLHWGPTLGRRLYKHHCCIHPGRSPIAWLHGVTQMEARCYNHVPVIRAMAIRVNELLSGLKATEYKWDHWEQNWDRKAQLPPPDLDTYQQLASAYCVRGNHMTVDMLLDLEELIYKTESLPVLLDHPAITIMLAVDEM